MNPFPATTWFHPMDHSRVDIEPLPVNYSIKDLLEPNPFVIEACRVKEFIFRNNITIEKLLQDLIPLIKEYARPQISKYKVGVAALGESGNIYTGVNLEFKGTNLSNSVHGEQFVLINIRNHNDRIKLLATSAAPCGHCRQFINEIGKDVEDLKILIPGHEPMSFKELLPHAFGPQDLGVDGGLMHRPRELEIDLHDLLIEKAAKAAFQSYAPYSRSFSGVVIEMKDRETFTGCNLDNAAFNPSIPPILSALVALVAAGKKYNYDDIDTVYLVEPYDAMTEKEKVNHEPTTRSLLNMIAPKANFTRVVRPEVINTRA